MIKKKGIEETMKFGDVMMEYKNALESLKVSLSIVPNVHVSSRSLITLYLGRFQRSYAEINTVCR